MKVREFERVSAGVPWPRGIVVKNGDIYVLARGLHRSAGCPSPYMDDMAGTIFKLDAATREPVIDGGWASDVVRANATVVAAPDGPPFFGWDTTLISTSDRRESRYDVLDRPYATLVWHEDTASFYMCGFSGIDLPVPPGFRKNHSDTIHRYDMRDGAWRGVESHDRTSIPADKIGELKGNYQYYPHRGVGGPCGILFGPDGLHCVQNFLYAVGKENDLLVRYELTPIVDDPLFQWPTGKVVLGDRARYSVSSGDVSEHDAWGHSALTSDRDYLYIGFRTTSQVVRYALNQDGDIDPVAGGQLIALFDSNANLIDLAIDKNGELFVSTSTGGRIWRIGVPNPNSVFDGRMGSGTVPIIEMPAMTFRRGAKCSNIAFDDSGGLIVCSGNKDVADPQALPGSVYRAEFSLQV